MSRVANCDNTERNAEIVRLRKAGCWPADIAKTMGITRKAVIGVCYRAGLANKYTGSAMVLRGDDHPSAKLTRAQVDTIRATYRPYCPEFGQRAQAKRYSVDPQTIRSVIAELTWADR